MSTKEPEKEVVDLPTTKKERIPIENVEQVVVDAALADKLEPSAASEARFYQEIFDLLLSKDLQKIYVAVKRILTISFVPILFLLVVAWLIVVVLFVLASAFKWHEFYLAESVLIALITSTTATVLGLFHYVARWLFAVNPKDPPDEPDGK